MSQEFPPPPDGPGKVEPWGSIFFTEGRGLPVEVEIDEDGAVRVEWTEPSDDFFGTNTRRVDFTAEEFGQIIAERAYIQTMKALRGLIPKAEEA